ncbi:MAG: hypothetical protein LBM18_02330 [Oscillospiraceae bacterium]|jgi:flagellar motility protein MotE (MotC chaperone)|nr:hypothetical protein [Oscillospiraceae bacterium]
MAIDDIEEGGQPTPPQKTAKPQKPAKPAKPTPKPADKKAPAKKPEKKKHGFPVGFTLFVLALAIIGAGVFAVVKNIGGMRDKAIELITSLDSHYVEVAEREAALAGKETELSTRESAIESKEERLTLLERDLNAREESIETQENQKPIYRRPLDEQSLADIQALADTYAAMDPVDAASILTRLYTTEDMAGIIYYMDSDAAAAVLTEMRVDIAAAITQLLLYEADDG